MKKGVVITVLLTVIISSGVFFGLGLLLLPAELSSMPPPKGEPADDFVSGVEYGSDVENCSLLLIFSDGSGALCYLDFQNMQTGITVYNDNPVGQAVVSRFGLHNRVFADNEFLCSFCDRIGGIELTEGGTKRRYLSASLRQKLDERADNSIREAIINAFFEKIAKIGLSTDDFKFIIEETENDLNFTVCYDWARYTAPMAENRTFYKE